jgi:hypothetical protein
MPPEMRLEHSPEQRFQFLPEHVITSVARASSQLNYHVQRTETRRPFTMAGTYQAFHPVAVNSAWLCTLAYNETEPGHSCRPAQAHAGKAGTARAGSARHDCFKLDGLGQSMTRHRSSRKEKQKTGSLKRPVRCMTTQTGVTTSRSNHAQASTAFGTTGTDDRPATPGLHANPETVGTRAPSFGGLVGALHIENPKCISRNPTLYRLISSQSIPHTVLDQEKPLQSDSTISTFCMVPKHQSR